MLQKINSVSVLDRQRTEKGERIMVWLLFGIFIGIILGGIGVFVLCAWIAEGGCECCDNGEHLNLQDKYGHSVHCTYCPICGKRVN